LQQQINRMFEESFVHGRPSLTGEGGALFAPAVEIVDSEHEIRVSAELPGIESKDLEINGSEDSLSIRGEKRHERHAEHRGVEWTERTYGSFERVIPLPIEVNAEACKAEFKNGVLEIILPKREGAKPRSHKVKVE
jgi:HSP20 family protein